MGLTPSFGIPEIYKTNLIRGGPSKSPRMIVAPSLATFSSFFARHKICVRAESNECELCARALFIPGMKKEEEEDITNNTELLFCLLSGPYKANKKRVMLRSTAMDLGHQGAFCRAAGVVLKPCRSLCFCLMALLTLSHTHRVIYLWPKLLQPFLICFPHMLLYKEG